jgi:hypothetical protein
MGACAVSLDLTRPDHAYVFGFAQADGHLSSDSRNRGCLGIELSERDEDVLAAIAASLSVVSHLSHRVRDTNFARAYRSSTLKVYDRAFREELVALGLPVGPKSRTITPPSVPLSERDYWRGIVDADGSLGITATGIPFLSLTCASPALASAFVAWCAPIAGIIRSISPNTRDGVFNIAYFKEDAQRVVHALYDGADIALDRKRQSSVAVLAWTRPTSQPAPYRRRPWSPEEDAIALSMTVPGAAVALGRTHQSVSVRSWRLRGGKKEAA